MAVVAMAALAGCGSSTSQFVGTWQITSGTQSITCGTQVTNNPLTGEENIVTGKDSNTITLSLTSCTETFSVDSADTGATATSQTCATTFNGAATLVTFTTDQLTRNGQTFSEAAIGSLVEGSTTCSVVQSYTATRTSSVPN